MSPSFMKKTMVYLGLLDDEYDEYDDSRTAPRVGSRPPRPRGWSPGPLNTTKGEKNSAGV